MAVSKNKRKNGKTKTYKHNAIRVMRQNSMSFSTCLSQKDLDKLRGIVTNVEMLAEMKLLFGKCDYQDVAMIRDTLNFCAFAYTYRTQVLNDINEDWVKGNAKAFNAAMDAFGPFYDRGNAKGGQHDTTVRYVAKGEELCALRDGVLIAADFFRQMLDEKPILSIKLFMAMKEITNTDKAGLISYDSTDIERLIANMRYTAL